MIGQIKSAWLRKPLVVISCFTVIPIGLLCLALAELCDWVERDVGDLIRGAWRGPGA
jgi:hypothetical protein